MTRNAIALVVGCLYVAGSSWLVLGEGRSYREALRRERLSVARNEASPPAPSGPESSPVADSIAAKPTHSPTETPSSAPPAVPGAIPAATIARANPRPAPPPTSPVEEKPTPATRPRTDRRADAAPPPTAPATPHPLWDRPDLKRSWDLAALHAADEARLGAELHGLILQLNERSVTGPWQRRVTDAAEPFVKACQRKDVRYTFTVLESDAVCAFSHPGGYVYVCRGLFDLIGEDEDYALEFAVGHEIAHVDLQHAVRSLRDPGVVKIPMGTLQKLYMIIVPFAYLDDAEFEADRWIYSRMRQAGRTERECLTFLRKLEGYARRNGFENGRIQPKPIVEASLLENHYRAHTATWDRLKHLKAFIGHTAGPTK